MPLRGDPYPRLSPDGWYYLRAAMGLRVPQPYARRWFLPAMLGPDPTVWVWTTWVALGLTPALAWAYFGDWRPALLLSLMPGVWRIPRRFPILLDAPLFAGTLAVAILTREYPYAGAVAALLLGATCERGPVFAAVWAWSPWPLAGLLASGWWLRPAPPDQPWLTHPVRAALDLRRAIGWDWSLYTRPLGLAWFGFDGSLRAILAVCLALGQLLTAQDTIRLTVWCAPVLLERAPHTWPAFLVAVIVAAWRDDRA